MISLKAFSEGVQLSLALAPIFRFEVAILKIEMLLMAPGAPSHLVVLVLILDRGGLGRPVATQVFGRAGIHTVLG